MRIMKKIRHGIMAVTVILGTLVVCVLLIEGVGRATGLLELQDSAMRPSVTKGYELDPARPHINSHGLRDREFLLQKPENTFRILALGDSFTYGAGVTLEETYVKQLEAMLNKQLRGHGIQYEILNAGVPGYNTRMEFIHLQEVGLQFKPDMILVGFTLSDAELGYFGLKNMGSQRWPMRVKTWVKDNFALYSFFRLRLKRLISRIQSVRYGVEVGGAAVLPLQLAVAGKPSPGWELCRQSLADFAAVARQHNIPIWLVIYPFLGNLDETYPFEAIHALVSKTAMDYGMGTIDLLPYFLGREPSTLWVSPQDSHPNGSANAIAARGIYEVLLTHRFVPNSTYAKPVHLSTPR
jgi:lysophospholipase L1-like esterase